MKKNLLSLLVISLLLSFGLVTQVHAQTTAPDLNPTVLQLTDVNGNPKTTFQVGEPIYVSVTIQNTGGQSPDPGTNSTYEAFYQNSPTQITGCTTPSDPPNFYLHNGLFSPQASNTWQSYPTGYKSYLFEGIKSWTVSTPGTYKAWVYVDYNCKIPESNEANNELSATYTIVSSTGVTPTTSPLPTGAVPVVVGSTDLPQEGSWIKDPDVTTIGKNAARSGQLLDWTLQDYKWASDSAYTNNPLVPLWLVIQRIVYALFLFVVLVTAFILIVTRGRSLTAKRFLPRFFLVVLLVTFSFSLVQFLYQIVDIFQGFFLKNPAGHIISQKDLLYVGFDYQSFVGLRVFGQAFDESAFVSLLLVKLTAFTYYAMVILLIFRKIILWFLIIVSPVFPLLLLFYPLRNTAKIWVGEFFRWLLYAPLFAIFLSGLVRLWHSGLPLVFNFSGVGNPTTTIYPTAINILLGGPGQNIGLNNSVNLPDTFALYLVALLMLWTVIILPFILLQIFLDYMMSFNYQNNPFIKQIYTMLSNRPIAPFSPLPPSTPPPATTGLARNLPFGRHFEIPKTTGLAKQIPTTASQTVTRPTLVTRNNQTEISRLTSLSIPTMRDIARLETIKLSKDVSSKQEIERAKQTLVSIANPASVSSMTERDRFRMIRERLVTEGQRGNSVATTILNAATTYNTYNTQSSVSSVSQSTQQLVQHLASPTLITSKRDQQKVVEIKQQLENAAKEGNKFATTILNSVNSYTTNQVNSLQQLLQGVSHPEKVTDSKQKEVYASLREKIVTASKSGNPLASLLATSLDGSSSPEQVKKIQDQLLEAKAQGNPLAAEVLKSVTSEDKTTEKDMEKLHETLKEASAKGDPLATLLLKTLTSAEKPQAAPVSAQAKLKSGALPQVNRIQQVSLEDYEAVKKMWKDSYKNAEVPQGLQNRKEWINQDVASIQDTISLLSSTNPQDVEKGMQQVSDILPFLLIGGFSQTEIIAYLKAKMEAGKNVLEETNTQTEEEDTLVETKSVSKTATKQMAASAEVGEDTAPETNSTSVTNVNNYDYSTTQNVTNESTNVTNTSAQTEIDTNLLTKTQLKLPKLLDIVNLETNNTQTSAVTSIKQILTNLAHPEKVANSTEREKIVQLRDEIIKESTANNPLAQMIVSAMDTVESLPEELSEPEAVQFAQTLQEVLAPQLVNQEEMTNFQNVNNELVVKTRQNDQLAVEVTNESTKLQLEHFDQAKDFLTKLSNPSQLTTASEQMHYNKLVERIAQASEDGNPTATAILKTVREPITKDSIAKLTATISLNASKGDNLATYIQQSMVTMGDEEKTSVTNLYQKLRAEKANNNPLATSLLKLFSRELRPKTTKSVTLPKTNRLQQVTVDDYETVKKMWMDNYQTSETPKGQSREAWIKNESDMISETINLLSSADPMQVQLGMEKVGDILPFLLLGGFSKDEIIGYLKAKLSAGQEVLKGTPRESSKVTLPVKSQSIAHVQHDAASDAMETPEPFASDLTITDAQIFLLTLREILDPSLVSDQTLQQNYRAARDMLTQARQNGDARAMSLMKLVDTVSQRETEAISSLLRTIDSPQSLVDDTKRQAAETMRSKLEGMQTGNPLAAALLKASHTDITPVGSNTLRVQLVEKLASYDPLALEVMFTWIQLPESVTQEIQTNCDQLLKTKNGDAFSILFMRLFTEQKERLLAYLKGQSK